MTVSDPTLRTSAAAVVLDAGSHTADAIQRAAYRLADRCTVEIARDGDNFRCTLFFPGEVVDDAAIEAFRTGVVDESLRERIRAETEGVRNLILALAFANTGLTGDGQEQ